MYDPYADFSNHVLSNGLEVHSVFWDRPWIKVEIVVHSGSREDPLALPGLAHFVEHVVSENIPGRTFDEAKRFFEDCGGHAGFGGTCYCSTRYKFGVPADPVIFRETLAIYGSMLIGARLEKNIERERAVITREFNERCPYPENLKWQMDINRALFRGHRLETWNAPIGRPEGFLEATGSDLQSFYESAYIPANISMAIVGGVHAGNLIAELQKSPFGSQKNGLRNQIPRLFAAIPVPAEQTKIVKMSDHSSLKVEQTEYKALWAIPASFPRLARRVFDGILCDILFEEIREKRGLAYNIGTDYEGFQDVYRYEIAGKIKPEATDEIGELVRTCISLVPSRTDLFERKIRSYMQQCSMIDLSGSGLADNAGQDLSAVQRIISMQEIWDDLKKVTHEQMAEAAGFLSPEQQYTFINRP